MPDNVISITENAFTGSNITDIKGSGDIYLIGAGAFDACQKLTKAEFLNTTSDCIVGQNTFKNCSNLKEVKFGDVATFSHNIFQGCSSLESLYLLGDATADLHSGAFSGVNSDVKIYVKPALVDSWKNKLKGYSLDDNVYAYNEE
jgi:hypothetical protein